MIMAVVKTVFMIEVRPTACSSLCELPMHQKDSVSDASALLDLDGLAVDRVESDAFGAGACTS